MIALAQAAQEAHRHEWVPILWGFLSGGGVTAILLKFVQYIAKNMPACPKDANFLQQLLYNMVKGTTSIDPNKTAIPTETLDAAKVALKAAGVSVAGFTSPHV